MDRFKRKLALLDIPVFEIADENEIKPRVASYLHKNGIVIGKQSCSIGTEPECSLVSDQSGGNDIVVESYTALLGVEESGIFIIERNLAERLNSYREQTYSVILLSECNIVESVEVALLRIGSGSDFNDKQFVVIQPESLSAQSLVFILKSI
ncbi:hypothetical protein ACMXYR_05290 [Neptuniibacter sp. QD29_5]